LHDAAAFVVNALRQYPSLNIEICSLIAWIDTGISVESATGVDPSSAVVTVVRSASRGVPRSGL